jgi:hypothetical protein
MGTIVKFLLASVAAALGFFCVAVCSIALTLLLFVASQLIG